MSASASNGRRPPQVISLVSDDEDEDDVVMTIRPPPIIGQNASVRQPVPRLPDPTPPPASQLHGIEGFGFANYGDFEFDDFPVTPGAFPGDQPNEPVRAAPEPTATPGQGGQIVMIDGEEIFIPDSPGPAIRPAPPALPQQNRSIIDAEVALALDEQNFTADTCLQRILIVCPDVNHEHVTKLYDEFGAEVLGSSRFERILDKLLSSDYPKQDKGKQAQRKRKREDDEDEQARKRWEAPDRDFTPFASVVRTSMIAALKADFPEVTNKQLDLELRSHKHFYPTYIALAKVKDGNESNALHRGRAPKNTADADTIALNSEHPTMYEELQAARKRVQTTRAEKAAEKAKRQMEEENLQRAMAAGETAECQACFDDLPMNRQIHCNGDVAHFTCFDCATTYIKSEVGESRCRVMCTAGCGAGYAHAQLHRLEDKQLLERLEQLQQEKDIRDAGLDDLEECPFCEYKAILPPIEEDFEFRCANTECEKVSCRRCKAVSHIPKSCEEHAKDNKLDSRHKIEEAMTAAMLRSCNKCKKQFIKDYGCNKMTCPSCGNLQCYVCSQTLKDYNHFDQGPGGPNVGDVTGKKCPLYDNVEERHEREVKEAEAAARAKVMENDPDAREEDLQIKVSEVVKKATEDRIKRAGGGPGGMPGAGPYGGLFGLVPGLRNARVDQADFSDEEDEDSDDDDDDNDDDDDDNDDDDEVELMRDHIARRLMARAQRDGPPGEPAVDRAARMEAVRNRLDALNGLIREGRRPPVLGGQIAGHGVQAPVARPAQPAHTAGLAHRHAAPPMQGFIPVFGFNNPGPVFDQAPLYQAPVYQAPVQQPPQSHLNFAPPPPPPGNFGPGRMVGARNNALPGQQGLFDALAEDPFGGGDAYPFGFGRIFQPPQMPEMQQPLQPNHPPERPQHFAAHREAMIEQQRRQTHREAMLEQQRQAHREAMIERQRQVNMHNRVGDREAVRELAPQDPRRYDQGGGFPGAPQSG